MDKREEFFTNAEDSFSKALELRRQLHQAHLINEPLAGLVRVHLERHLHTRKDHHLNKALDHAQEIIPHITESWNLHGTHDPIDICLAVHEVLTAAGDQRADQVLDTAHAQLHQRAGTIDDPETHKRYLARRPHQQIIAHKAKRQR